MREIGDSSDLALRVDRAILRRLRDGDRARLNMVLVPQVMKVLRNAGDGDLPVRSGDRQELATDLFFRCARLGGMDVRRVRADDRLMRAHHALQTEHICGGAAEEEEDFPVTELARDPRYGIVGVSVAAVRRDMTGIHRTERREHLRMNSRPVVARKAAWAVRTGCHFLR